MGFLDIFKKKDNQNSSTKVNNRNEINSVAKPQMNKPPFEINYKVLPDGNFQVELYERNAEFKKFYDITRLIISKQQQQLADHTVWDCSVSWYGKSDCHMIDPKTGILDSPRALDYRNILAEFDVRLLQTDPNYCNAVMTDLMDKKRVAKYLSNGLDENSPNPCGKYIGGMQQAPNNYIKFFYGPAGRASHYSPSMVAERQKQRIEMEQRKQQAIMNKRAEIARLQNELNSMQFDDR